MITVMVPISPIVSHPQTFILDETIASVRHHLPDAEILLMFDGVRVENEDRRPVYEEHIRRVLWKADKQWGNTAPFIFDAHRHQVGMLRAVMDEIRTPLLLFVEQDTPLVSEPIDWQACVDIITTGDADVVRLSHEAVIPIEHEHLMLGVMGNFLRTCQFSARPHLASTAYYRRLLADHFSPEACCFVEDVAHGVCQNAYIRDGLAGWYGHRLWIYHPPGGNIKRSYTTDGRAGEPKYAETQVF